MPAVHEAQPVQSAGAAHRGAEPGALHRQGTHRVVPTAAGCHNLVERGRRVPGLPAVAALPDLHRLAVRRDRRPELQNQAPLRDVQGANRGELLFLDKGIQQAGTGQAGRTPDSGPMV